MMRREVAKVAEYDPTFSFAEDYELWIRLASRFRISNVQEVLLRYRVSSQHMTPDYAKKDYAYASCAQHSYLVAIGLKPDKREFIAHNGLAWRMLVPDAPHLQDAAAWLNTLWRHNQQIGRFKPEALRQVMEFKIELLRRLVHRHCPQQEQEIMSLLPVMRES